MLFTTLPSIEHSAIAFQKTDNASKEQCRQVCQLSDNMHGLKSGSRSQASKVVLDIQNNLLSMLCNFAAFL